MLRFLFSPYGRISRRDWWLKVYLGSLALVAAALAIDLLLLKTEGPGPTSDTVGLLWVWPIVAAYIKRLHDLGRTGWWLLAPVSVGLLCWSAIYFGRRYFGPDAAAPYYIAAVAVGFIVNAALLFFVFFVPGQRGVNKYGPDPLMR
jgi:uncharacterized membrane protein YhaH (DUF805 family)